MMGDRIHQSPRFSPSMIVASGSFAKAAAMAGKRSLNRFLLRENSVTRPSCFTAKARYPSSFNSYCHASPSGNFFTARHGMGSMKYGSVIGKSIFALPSIVLPRKIVTIVTVVTIPSANHCVNLSVLVTDVTIVTIIFPLNSLSPLTFNVQKSS